MKLGIVCTGVLLVVGAVIFAMGFFGPKLISDKVKSTLQDNLYLRNGSATFPTWQDNSHEDSVPLYQSFYFFNITNKDAVLAGTEKPNLVEVGPYTYRKNMIKHNLNYSASGDEVTYNTWTYFTFVKNGSRDPTQDYITTVNLAYAGGKVQLGDEWYLDLFFDVVGSMTLTGPIVTRTVQELIWGYDDPMLLFLNTLQKTDTFLSLQKNQTSPNDSPKQPDTINTGKSDVNKILQFSKFHGEAYVDKWASTNANRVAGTDGSQFRPQLTSGDKVFAWVDDGFRTMELECKDPTSVEEINLLSCKLSPEDFMNSTQYASNADYYQFGPSGVGNLTSVFKAPVFLSSPHFLNAPWYLERVDGLKPNATLHETHLDVEPNTGVVMRAAKRLQINVVLSSSIVRNPNTPTTYVPLVWIDLTSTITPTRAADFREKNSGIEDAHTATIAVRWVGWLVGGACLVVSLILIAIFARRAIQHRDRGYSAIQ